MAHRPYLIRQKKTQDALIRWVTNTPGDIKQKQIVIKKTLCTIRKISLDVIGGVFVWKSYCRNGVIQM